MILFLNFVLAILLSMQVFADTVRLSNDPWPPYVVSDTDGLSVEIIRKAFNDQEFNVEVKLEPWKRAYLNVLQGKTDVLMAAWKTPKREADLLFSDPYYINELVFIKRRDDPFTYQSLEDLSGLSVGVVAGYGYNTDFLSTTHFNRIETNNLTQNLRKLLASRIDLSVADRLVSIRVMDNSKLERDKIEFVSEPLARTPLHIAVSYNNPRHKYLIEYFNQELIRLKSTGGYDAILKRYEAL
jgi:polar amino acid transport system substrate-binding protein